jgi:hypothetical protein
MNQRRLYISYAGLSPVIIPVFKPSTGKQEKLLPLLKKLKCPDFSDWLPELLQ